MLPKLVKFDSKNTSPSFTHYSDIDMDSDSEMKKFHGILFSRRIAMIKSVVELDAIFSFNWVDAHIRNSLISSALNPECKF